MTGGPPVRDAAWYEVLDGRGGLSEPAARVADLLAAELPEQAPFRVGVAGPGMLRLAFDDVALGDRYAAALRAEHAPVSGVGPGEVRLACADGFGSDEVATVALQVLKVTHYLSPGEDRG